MNPRRLRLGIVVAGLLSAAVLLGAWTQPWFVIGLDTPLPVSGQSAAPALSGIALAAFALLGALMIARSVLRRILGVVLLGLGVLSSVIITPLVVSAEAASRASASTIAAATGLSGSEALASLDRTGWPVVGLAAAVLMTAVGLAVVITAARWPASTTKYDTGAAKPDTTAGTWDALSEGDDPTSR